ncbi:hypothetical protein BGZ63DRAFT_381903 [Mariannaea sp. PMI_226]|nr:hypothetical protein BGZ63DRAFT_381903 [Mariannaea sp. PMI_226]
MDLQYKVSSLHSHIHKVSQEDKRKDLPKEAIDSTYTLPLGNVQYMVELLSGW